MTCSHPTTEIGRVMFRGGFHVMERCTVCLCNARGEGKWVPKSEVSVSLSTLPIFRQFPDPDGTDRGTPADPKQRGLFDQ
jgi:hypothetical protein